MEITVFAKKRTTHEGKKFFTYLTTLTRKDGTTCTASVKFAEGEAPKPDICPCNLIVEKGDCNMSKGEYINPETGEVKDTFTLWVKRFSMGSPFVDTSMDDFM